MGNDIVTYKLDPDSLEKVISKYSGKRERQQYEDIKRIEELGYEILPFIQNKESEYQVRIGTTKDKRISFNSNIKNIMRLGEYNSAKVTTTKVNEIIFLLQTDKTPDSFHITNIDNDSGAAICSLSLYKTLIQRGINEGIYSLWYIREEGVLITNPINNG